MTTDASMFELLVDETTQDPKSDDEGQKVQTHTPNTTNMNGRRYKAKIY